MNQFLLFLHFFGLMLGAGPGIAQGLIARRAEMAQPEEAKTLRSLGPMLANVSAVGIVILWITGPIMVGTVYGGFANLPGAFWIKFAFVVLLTLIVIYMQVTFAQMRRGNLEVAARLGWLGPAAGVVTLLAVLFAVIAFDVH
jgi:hypothetical protein